MTRLVAILAFTALCALAMPALDFEASPFDYIRPVKGGKYVFVMLAPGAATRLSYSYKVYADGTSRKSSTKEGRLFKKYPASGLYRATGPAKPLWTVNWYSFDVRVCSDGEHLVRFGPWARSGDQGKTLALAFYRSGKEIRSYAVRDLVPDYRRLPHSVSHYLWMKASSLDDVKKRLKVEIHVGNDYKKAASKLFDLRTGYRMTPFSFYKG
jgi:hypothetical protein